MGMVGVDMTDMTITKTEDTMKEDKIFPTTIKENKSNLAISLQQLSNVSSMLCYTLQKGAGCMTGLVSTLDD